jgi:hypothetical protein
MDRLIVYLFLASVVVGATVGLLAPQRVLKPKGDSWFFDWMMGRTPYTSIRRVRWTCATLLLVAVMLIVGSVLFPA